MEWCVFVFVGWVDYVDFWVLYLLGFVDVDIGGVGVVSIEIGYICVLGVWYLKGIFE